MGYAHMFERWLHLALKTIEGRNVERGAKDRKYRRVFLRREMSCIIAAAFIVAGAAAAGVVVEVAAVAVAFLLSPGHPAPDKVAGISCCGRRPPGGEGRPETSARLVHPPLRAL